MKWKLLWQVARQQPTVAPDCPQWSHRWRWRRHNTLITLTRAIISLVDNLSHLHIIQAILLDDALLRQRCVLAEGHHFPHTLLQTIRSSSRAPTHFVPCITTVLHPMEKKHPHVATHFHLKTHQLSKLVQQGVFNLVEVGCCYFFWKNIQSILIM